MPIAGWIRYWRSGMTCPPLRDSIRGVHKWPPARSRVRHDTNSVCRGQTHRRIRLRYLSPDRVENRAGAIRSGLSTRELNPDIGQPQTLGGSPLGRYGAIRRNAAVMHAHAAVPKDRVEIGFVGAIGACGIAKVGLLLLATAKG